MSQNQNQNQTQGKGKGKGQGKSRRSYYAPLSLEASRDAEAGIVRTLDSTGALVGEKRITPYYNRVYSTKRGPLGEVFQGKSGRDKLTLRKQSFENSRANPLIFLKAPRVVGTREELTAAITAAGGNINDYLAPNNMVDEASLLTHHRGTLESEVRAATEKRKSSKGLSASVLNDLNEILVLAAIRKAEKKVPKEKKSPRASGAQKSGGGRIKNLKDRLQAALASGSVVDVSNMKETGAAAKTVSAPGAASGKKNVEGAYAGIYSSNLANYRRALELLGADAAVVNQHATALQNRLSQAGTVGAAGAGVAAPATLAAPVLGGALAPPPSLGQTGARTSGRTLGSLGAVPTAAPVRGASPRSGASVLGAPVLGSPVLGAPVFGQTAPLAQAARSSGQLPPMGSPRAAASTQQVFPPFGSTVPGTSASGTYRL